MPRLIDVPQEAAMTPDAVADALAETTIDPRDPDAVASLAPLLARLARDRRFLSDAAIGELKRRCSGQSATSAYGAQVLLLPRRDPRFTLRANFWPAAGDAVLRAGGPAAFVYGMAHDHDFDFLTVGYLGPGYRSEDYRYDPACLNGVPGERAGLVAQGMTRLAQGTLLMYQRHHDVHRQHPPERFSVSLNILVRHPDQPWSDQLHFDVAADRVIRTLTTTPAEALLALSVALDLGNGHEVAEHCARHHRSPRMRWTATRALIDAAAPERRSAMLERAAGSPCGTVSARARAMLAQMAP